MPHKISQNITICIVGLGYVGYPLADAFSKHVRTIGYDLNLEKIIQINSNPDNKIIATADPAMISEADIIIIAVPTPVMRSKDPDISYIVSAGEIIGRNLSNGAIVVLESTVYPGLTEEVLLPTIERASGKICGKDFFIGYSPERINPGDEERTLKNTVKIVAGMDYEVTEYLANTYALVTNVYKAPNIRTAEAAKVIENIQRDINIALVNELSIIFRKMGLDTRAVLEAAGTKWNFHRYRPGLVGGHCIPVDPYYLVYKAKELGYHPQVILAGRAINDAMPRQVADMVIKELNRAGKVIRDSNVLILGLTYKENVPDTRESPVGDLIRELHEFDIKVYGHDPLLDSEEIERFNAEPVTSLGDLDIQMECIVINSPHDAFASLTLEKLLLICNGKPIIIDVPGLLQKNNKVRNGCAYLTL